MITREQFLADTDEDELFAVIESFLERARQKNLFNVDEDSPINKQLILLDKDKAIIIRDILKEFQKDKSNNTLRNQIIDLIKKADKEGGFPIKAIYYNLHKGEVTPLEIDKEIQTLLEDGFIFECKLNTFRWLRK